MKKFTIVIALAFIFTIFGTLSTVMAGNPPGTDGREWFEDALCTRLKAGVSMRKMKKQADSVYLQIADRLQKGDYPEYRIQEYEAYPVVATVAKQLKTSAYSQFENPTGIYFEAGDEAVVFLENTGSEDIKMRVHNFGPEGGSSYYPLKAGENRFKLKNRGLAYINYFTDNRTAPNVKVHIATGKVNGYFDRNRHTDADWKRLLQNAVCDILDIRGDRIQLAYAVEDLKKYCPEEGSRLIAVYDTIVRMEHNLMGLDKYGVRPKNHMFARVIWKGFMHADGVGAAFHTSTMKDLADPAKAQQNSWGIAHELGHVNQVRPGFKWVSTSEVTNNVYSAWVQYNFTPHKLRLEHEAVNGGDGRMTGGRFNAYLNNGIMKGQNWLLQVGPERKPEKGGDLFVRLCPLWQLQLYYAAAGFGNKDLYADVIEIVRNTDDSKLSNGQMQLNFMKNACDVQKQNLTGFFTKAGLLKPIDRTLGDYGKPHGDSHLMQITEQQCNELREYAKKYPEPESPVIYYISGNSVGTFKNKAAVTGQYGQGVTGEEVKTVDGKVWKNVTVFETYEGDRLVRIAMVGTGSADNSSTLVQYPAGATRIEAVAWDGTRTLVYGKR